MQRTLKICPSIQSHRHLAYMITLKLLLLKTELSTCFNQYFQSSQGLRVGPASLDSQLFMKSRKGLKPKHPIYLTLSKSQKNTQLTTTNL